MVRKPCRRPGTTLVEAAIVYPVTFLFLLGLVIGAMGMFRHQEVASLAREASRWASVRGGQYAKDTGNAAATADDVAQQVALQAVALDASRMTTTVSWSTDNWPSHVTGDDGNAVLNTVTVTVTYRWLPEAYLGGLTLSSTSVVPMEY